mgnify:CR=1 FL=1
MLPQQPDFETKYTYSYSGGTKMEQLKACQDENVSELSTKFCKRVAVWCKRNNVKYFGDYLIAPVFENFIKEIITRPTHTDIVWPDKFLHIGDEIIDGWIDKANERIDACRAALSSHLSRRVDEERIERIVGETWCNLMGSLAPNSYRFKAIAKAIAAALNKGEV